MSRSLASLHSMRSYAAIIAIAAAGAGFSVETLASTADASAALPAQIATCGSCHGEHGEGQDAAGVPRLAGLKPAYLKLQLQSFASGTRDNAMMAPLAKPLTAAMMSALSDYYGKLSMPSVTAGLPDDAIGATIADRGDWSANSPACASCHGAQGLGVGDAFPGIAGQSSTYIANQLKAWQSGVRHDDPFGLMQTIAKRLSDVQITAVSAHYAAAQGIVPLPKPQPVTTSVLQPKGPASSPGVVFAPPPESAIPDNEFGKIVRDGEAIFRDPALQARQYVGNQLSCSNCHLDAGRLANASPMWAAYVAYPAYRSKNGHVNTFQERLQGCFRFSMNGKAPPLGDPVLVALESYAYFLAKGAPIGAELPGRGYPEIAKPAQGMDYQRGQTVYQQKCTICHGADGEGQASTGIPVFPALWGSRSFNWGAGMGSVTNAAAFIKANMPLGQGNTLTDQEAWDVAMFVDGHERPQDPRFVGTVAATRAKFHHSDGSLYGQAVAGVVLGEHSAHAKYIRKN